MTSDNELRRQYRSLGFRIEKKENEREVIIREHMEKIQPEIDKLDKQIHKMNERNTELYDKIINNLLKSGDLDY